jgi:(p)ppGpp synthase/HD superfamily hydrolase
MKQITKIQEAAYLAVAMHGKQKYGDKPYFYHLEQVVNVLREFDYESETFLIAGYLHDVLEDTSLSYSKLDKQFGTFIADIVYDVTDELGKNRYDKKKLTLPKTAQNKDAIIVKLADRIANIRMGGKVDMYRKEYKEFKFWLYKADHADKMWAELDSLILA